MPSSRSPRLRRVEETSAGGLVVDLSGPAPLAVLIGRHDRQGQLKWSLPKGHIEPGETAEEAAVREVEEETGIVSQVVSALGTIDFWFTSDRRRIHKTVHHFLLQATGGSLSATDIEVDAVEWVPLDEVADRLCHEDERRLLRHLPKDWPPPSIPGRA